MQAYQQEKIENKEAAAELGNAGPSAYTLSAPSYCYSPALNTCLYSTEFSHRSGSMLGSVIDLLDGRELASYNVAHDDKDRDLKIAAFNLRKSSLFAQCAK